MTLSILRQFLPVHYDNHGLNSPSGERLLNFSKNPAGEYILPEAHRDAIAAFVAKLCVPPPAPKAKVIPMSEIRARYNPGDGRHFFDRSSMRFFASRLPASGYEGPGGVFFVTSEQFRPSSGPPEPRRFTVRQLIVSGDDADIKTVGEFNRMDATTARTMAKRLASTEPAKS